MKSHTLTHKSLRPLYDKPILTFLLGETIHDDRWNPLYTREHISLYKPFPSLESIRILKLLPIGSIVIEKGHIILLKTKLSKGNHII